jgi:protein-S-isoprenylcysteine O-methyltransferase Ste14
VGADLDRCGRRLPAGLARPVPAEPHAASPVLAEAAAGRFVIALRAHHPGGASFDAPLGWLGVAGCATGIGIAGWARVCLGRNWGMPMTVRARPTLVRSGPYRVVRHPIYSGLLLAAVGSALVTGPGWLVVVAGAGAYFVVSLRVEENDMARAFPDQYPEYAGHTKRLIPFVY